MKKSESIIELSKALSKFQGEVENPKNTSENPFFKSKYAPLEEVLNKVRPILATHGLSVTQIPMMEGDRVGVITILMHSSGEYIETEPLLLKTDKNTAQGAGSAITYARRYALSAVLGVASEEDDDGNSAESQAKEINSSKHLSEKQLGRMYAIAKSKNIDATEVKAAIMKRYEKSPEQMSKKEYDTVCAGYESLQVKSKE